MRAWWATPWSVRLLSAASIGLAIALSLASVPALAEPRVLGISAVLLAGGAVNVELGRRAEGGRVQRNRLCKGLSEWAFAVALLLPIGVAGLVAAALYAHCRVRGMVVPLWRWIGSWASVALAGAATSALLASLGGGPLPAAGSAALGLVLVAASVFLSVEAALLLAITRLNAREDLAYHEALRRPDFYMTEFAVLASGGIAALLCQSWPGLPGAGATRLCAAPARGAVPRLVGRRAPRRQDRLAQLRGLTGRGRDEAGAQPTHRPPAGRPAGRPRPLQAGQRYLWPPDRRPRADPRRGDAARAGAAIRPARRRAA